MLYSGAGYQARDGWQQSDRPPRSHPYGGDYPDRPVHPPAGEKDVLTLVAARLLCATDQEHRFEAVTAVLDCGGCSFTAKGKTVLQMGWKEVERLYRLGMKQGKTEEQDREDPALPELRESQAFRPVSASVREGRISPAAALYGGFPSGSNGDRRC